MLRKKISVLLAVAMVAGLAAGCGSSGGSTVENSVNESSAGTQAESVQESNAGQESADGEKELSAQEPYTVRIVADGYGSEEACAEISAAVSEITKVNSIRRLKLYVMIFQPMWIRYRQNWHPEKRLICSAAYRSFLFRVRRARGR